jgi:DNA replication regulator SLD3
VTKPAPKQKISTPSRPGAITKRPVPAKTNRSLQRALTDSRDRRSMSIGSNRAISLIRSATESSIPSLKRETSEAPSLSGIPAAESKPLYASRGGVLNTKRFSQREVDMSSLAPDLTSKAKKQAAIEAELKDAISALKKPNRELAGKSLAETLERRSVSASHPRSKSCVVFPSSLIMLTLSESKKPVRNPLFQGVQGVQIKATPKSSRQKDMFREHQLPTSTPRKTEEQDLGFVAPSSISNVPQSTIRPSRDYNPFNGLVQATPSRKSFSSSSRAKSNVPMYDDELGALPPSSPLQARRSSAHIFNSVPDSIIKRPSTSSAPRGILETPVKRPSTSGMHFGLEETPVKQSTELEFNHSHPPTVGEDKENSRNVPKAPEVAKPFPTSRGNPDSIYAALGWDDDDIDDLA